MTYEHYKQVTARFNLKKADELKAYNDLNTLMGDKEFKEFLLSVISDYKSKGKTPPKTTSNSQIISILMGLESKLELALSQGFISNEEREVVGENITRIKEKSELSEDMRSFITDDE